MSTAFAADVSDDTARHISRIASVLATSRNAFPDDINYEIDGDVLTWIVRGYESEFKIECHNASEVIDGFYRAEYFLDTSKILDPYSELHAGLRCVEPEPEPEPRVIVSQQSIMETVKMVQLQRTLREELIKEEEAYHAAMQAYNETEAALRHTDNSSLQKTSKKPKAITPKRTKPKEKTTQEIYKPTKCVKVMNITREVREDILKEVLSTRNGGYMDTEGVDSPLESSFTSQKTYEMFTSDIVKREVRPMNTGWLREKRRKQEKIEDQTDIASDSEQNLIQEETSPGDTEDINTLRRGKRIRKNSIFQDFYIPISNNEWIAETFVKVPKITY